MIKEMKSDALFLTGILCLILGCVLEPNVPIKESIWFYLFILGILGGFIKLYLEIRL